MPGLLRGVARVAVASGTATAVSNRVSRRQERRWAGQAEPQPQYDQPQRGYDEPPPAPASAVPIDQLKELAALREQGVLTDEEFAAQKAKLLN